MPIKQQKTKGEIKGSRPESRLKRIYNYSFLVFLGLLVSISFLPAGTQKHLDKYIWNFPVIVTGIILVASFFLVNQKSVSSALSGPCVSGKKSPCLDFLAAGLIVAAAFMLFSYRLGALDLWDDEYLVVKAAQGYHRTGAYCSWDFIKDEPSQKLYTRAWPHTWLVAQSYRLFGVSEWSSRIVSVLFGCIFILASIFVTRFFTGDKFFSYLVAVVFLLNPDFMYYWRYARMYALLLPLFLIWSVLVFKAIEGKPQEGLKQNENLLPFKEYLNLDYVFLGLSVFFLYWGYQIHINSLLILPVALVYVATMAFMGRGKKYIALGLLALATGISAYVLLPRNFLQAITGRVAFFQSCNLLFLKLMVQRPFLPLTNLVLLFGGIVSLLLIPSKTRQKKMLFCFIMVLAAVIFFVFIVNFYGRHYRYISHVIPFAILCICFVYVVILRAYQNRFVLVIGTALLVAAQAANFSGIMKYLYYGAHNQPYPSVAYATVRDNLKPGEVVFAQYLRDYYMRGIPADTPIIDLGRVKQGTTGTNPYRFDRFFKDLITYGQGWVIWQKYKEHHVDPKVAAYVKTLFKHCHGQGIDDTGVEVYYFNRSMIKKPVFR